MYIHLLRVMKTVQLPCLCATLRRASRSLTGLYDEALRPHGMTITQFTILQALQLAGPVAQGQLGGFLALDSTTLTRSLRPLMKSGWVQRTEGKDRRAWRLTLSRLGTKAYNDATPDWERVQQSVHQKLGRQGWLDSFRSADELTTAAQTIGANQ